MRINDVVGYFKEVVSEWQADEVPTLGAALAYYSVFSIGPLLLIAITVAGAFFGRESVQQQVFDQLSRVMGPQGAQTVAVLLENAFKAGSGQLATIIAVGTLVFAASGIFNQLQSALNHIWGVPKKRKPGVWGMIAGQLVAVASVGVIGALLLATMLASTVLMALDTKLSALLPMASPLWHVPQVAVTFAAVTTLFALMYKYLPSLPVAWRDAWRSAAVTAVLFTAGELAIGAYLGITAPGSAYGAAGSLLVVLVWVYYSAQVFFFGVEMMKVSARRRGGRYTTLWGPEAPVATASEGVKQFRRE